MSHVPRRTPLSTFPQAPLLEAVEIQPSDDETVSGAEKGAENREKGGSELRLASDSARAQELKCSPSIVSGLGGESESRAESAKTDPDARAGGSAESRREIQDLEGVVGLESVAGSLSTSRGEEVSVGDLEVLRLILQGDSVIDWRRLHFRNREEVNDFLRLNLLDPDEPSDRQRLYYLLEQAVSYLRRTFRYKVPAAVAEPRELHDLFLLASGVAGPERFRRIACVVLKVMHTVHHIEARELLARTRLSEMELELMVDGRVREALESIQVKEGIEIANYQGSAKTRDSIITKLIAKKESVAAQIYDRLRYRIVVPHKKDLVPLVLALSRELFPFNYVVPGQTQNTLISFGDLVAELPRSEEILAQLQEGNGSLPLRAHEINEFSSRDYRILNFIVDLPMRIDATALAARKDRDDDLGRIVFTPVELQVLDVETQKNNESGDSAHPRYKRRQLRRVFSRLLKGLGSGRSAERRRSARSLREERRGLEGQSEPAELAEGGQEPASPEPSTLKSALPENPSEGKSGELSSALSESGEVVNAGHEDAALKSSLPESRGQEGPQFKLREPEPGQLASRLEGSEPHGFEASSQEPCPPKDVPQNDSTEP